MSQLSKQTKGNGLLTVKEVPLELAKKLTVENHYSHKWATPFGIINYGIFQEGNNECLGVAVFGHLMNPNSYKSICDNITRDQIIELNRLWVSDVLGHNTETVFLSLCFKLIRKDYPHIKLVQSFADGRLGCGTIYKASNFGYYGKLETLFFEDISNGEVTHKTLFEDTRSLATLADLNYGIASGKFKPFKVLTYRYIYAIDRKYLPLIKLKRAEYPPYNKGMNYIPDYVQSLGPMSRAYMAFYWLGMNAEMTQIKRYIECHYGEMSHDQIRDVSRSKTMDKFLIDEVAAKENLKQRYELRMRKLNRMEDVA